MKALIVLALIGMSSIAVAEEATTETAQNIAVQQYDYSQHLDIARVIAQSDVPNVCAVVPARMTYEDSQGKRHILEYRIMGNGCSNG